MPSNAETQQISGSKQHTCEPPGQVCSERCCPPPSSQLVLPGVVQTPAWQVWPAPQHWSPQLRRPEGQPQPVAPQAAPLRQQESPQGAG